MALKMIREFVSGAREELKKGKMAKRKLTPRWKARETVKALRNNLKKSKAESKKTAVVKKSLKDKKKPKKKNMLEREEVKAQVLKAWNNKEDDYESMMGDDLLVELTKTLDADEKVEKIMPTLNGPVIGTHKRILFVHRSPTGFSKWKLNEIKEFSYDYITCIEYKKKRWHGRVIKVDISGDETEFDDCHKEYIQDFCDYVRARMSAVTKHQGNRKAPKQPSSKDKYTKFEKLVEFKDKGILKLRKNFSNQRKKF